MSNLIRFADLRVDDIQRFALALEGLALAHWRTLPPGIANDQLPKIRELADELHYHVETLAIAWAGSGVEGIEGVELSDLEDGDDGEEWQGGIGG
jgi:hypothetical protein